MKLELLVDEQYEHPEGIVWDGRRERLHWVDVVRGDVVSYDPASGAVSKSNVGQWVGAVAPRRDGGVVCACGDGFGILDDDGSFRLVAPVLADEPELQLNDGGVDPAGRFWAGGLTFAYETTPGITALYRLDPDGSASRQLEGVSVSNGIAWSPDGSRCYYVDSATYRLDVFDFDVERGTLGARRPLATFEGLPDGIAVDVDGCIWVAVFRGWEVQRITPEGKVDRAIRLPGSQVTTCAFGGDDLRTLYIAVSPFGLPEDRRASETSGYIYAVDAGVQGLATPEFG
jgi:sugar lactone lactonase YvrE